MAVRIVSGPTVEPVTLAEAKAQCVIEHTADDAFLSALIKASRDHGEALTLRSWAPQVLAVVLPEFPQSGGKVDLPFGPVTAVDHIKYTDSYGVEHTLSSTEYTVDTRGLVANVTPKTSWPSGVIDLVIQYQAGWAAADFPHALRQWVLVRVSTLYAQREAIVVGPQMLTVMELSRNFVDCLLDRYTVLEG
jgi:uncharacterized phiE125 gp8 family phage protein